MNFGKQRYERVAIAVVCIGLLGCDERVLGGGLGGGNNGNGNGNGNLGTPDTPDVSPVRGVNQRADRGREPRVPNDRRDAFRSIDGTDNNRRQRDMGASHTPLRRRVAADYGDGVSALAGEGRPSARAVSNAVFAQSTASTNPRAASDFLWQWGQFLDHDIDLTDGTDPPEPAPIAVPNGDPFFDPASTGTAEIDLNRSLYDLESGTGPENPRQQLNEITHWIDASNVYGSEEERATVLRTNDGTGRLETSAGDLLPFNTEGLPNAGGSEPTLFLAGDVRANEQVGLAAMHTLFVREHNRLAAEIAANEPNLDGDEIYERAREIVAALMQVITYQEYLPALLGETAIAPYRGYDEDVDARITNLFSTAIYRYGHSALSPTLLRLDANGNEIAAGHLPLRDAFFSPQRLVNEGGIEPLLRGLAAQACQTIDAMVVDDVRNFLFGPPGSGGFDLVSLNIQRGRDHGLPSYVRVRQAFGLPAPSSFGDVTSNTQRRAALESVYDNPGEVDLWVGGLAEDPVGDAHVGALMRAVMKEQFEALRDGDRYWYTRTLPPGLRAEVEATRLSDVIRRNTSIGDEIADDVFSVQ